MGNSCCEKRNTSEDFNKDILMNSFQINQLQIELTEVNQFTQAYSNKNIDFLFKHIDNPALQQYSSETIGTLAQLHLTNLIDNVLQPNQAGYEQQQIFFQIYSEYFEKNFKIFFEKIIKNVNRCIQQKYLKLQTIFLIQKLLQFRSLKHLFLEHNLFDSILLEIDNYQQNKDIQIIIVKILKELYQKQCILAEKFINCQVAINIVIQLVKANNTTDILDGLDCLEDLIIKDKLFAQRQIDFFFNIKKLLLEQYQSLEQDKYPDETGTLLSITQEQIDLVFHQIDNLYK